jgi:hypothetical protein
MQSIKRRVGEERGRRREKKVKNSFDSLFESDWEVFVIKRDETTGQLVGKTACCALAKV